MEKEDKVEVEEGEAWPAEPAEVPGNQKQMQLLRISTVNPPIPLFFHCCVRILRHGGEDSVYVCFCLFPPMLVV